MAATAKDVRAAHVPDELRRWWKTFNNGVTIDEGDGEEADSNYGEEEEEEQNAGAVASESDRNMTAAAGAPVGKESISGAAARHGDEEEVSEDGYVQLQGGLLLGKKRKAIAQSTGIEIQEGKGMEGISLLSPDIDISHRAAKLEKRKLDTLVTRTPKENWRIHPAWVQRLKWAGLLPFARLVEATATSTRLSIDQSLLTCLVDRWRPETHTFHFRWGEMAPTLEDVSYLLGLPLAGWPIGPLQAPEEWERDMAQRFHGIYDNAPPFASEHHGPKLDWLLHFQIQKFPGYPAIPLTEPQITRSLEAYILWLLGKVMFTENHVTTITARYIPIALEIARATVPEHITPRSWGSAVLAATYRAMCNGCQLHTPKSALLGCPIFLQLWSWERFSIGRPDILVEQSYTLGELLDAEHIDMPTFGTVWTVRKRRFAHDQVKNCYPVFNEQFDVLSAVVWEPYTEAAIEERYPGGISDLCTRDRAYWMTQSKIIFDVYVEEMAQQRVMRQFGLRQMVYPPPTEDPLPPLVHKITRKGINRPVTQWLRRVQPYVTEWETATTRVWQETAGFDLNLFNSYLQRYMTATRIQIIHHSHSEDISAPAVWDMYPNQSTSASRQHAAELTHDLWNEVAVYAHSLSSGPLLGRQQQQSWARRLEEKLQGIYAAITCTRTSDVVHNHAAQRTPCPSMHQQQPRPSTHQQEPQHHRQQPRPRLSLQPTPIPPPPGQAGGSSWQQHQSPMSSFAFRPQPQPYGGYGYQMSMSGPGE